MSPKFGVTINPLRGLFLKDFLYHDAVMLQGLFIEAYMLYLLFL